MKSPIEHVVVIVKENHTFDNYFGTFPGANGIIEPQAANPPLADPSHTHGSWESRAKNATHQVQYKEADIPEYFDLARKFTLCDNYFSEVAGPSTPNHLMLVAASAPCINNPHNQYRPSASARYTLPNLPAELIAKKLTWGNYGGYVFNYFKNLPGKSVSSHGRDTFAKHVKAGTVPNVSWVFGDGTPNYSEHPVQNVTTGQQWTVDLVKTIAASPLWAKTMIFITWDDWGGWADHVTPPNVEPWNHNMAQHPGDAYPNYDGQQYRYGSRVPCLVVGPYAKPGHISSQLNSHVSIPRFIEDTFGLPQLSGRDRAANGLTDCYDFGQAPNAPYLPKLKTSETNPITSSVRQP
jgi:phospholipase C